MTPVFSLFALRTVTFDRLMQVVIGFRSPSLAIVMIGAQLRRSTEHQNAGQCSRSKYLYEEALVEIISHRLAPPSASILPLNHSRNNCKKGSTFDSCRALELTPLDTNA